MCLPPRKGLTEQKYTIRAQKQPGTRRNFQRNLQGKKIGSAADKRFLISHAALSACPMGLAPNQHN